jgi:hypothetical protein
LEGYAVCFSPDQKLDHISSPELRLEWSILSRRQVRPDPIILRMATDPESVTQQQILERFRRLFDRDMTVEERRGFFLPESPGEDIASGEPQ